VNRVHKTCCMADSQGLCLTRYGLEMIGRYPNSGICRYGPGPARHPMRFGALAAQR
jgi:hypothetical protein